jgi:hypothetical protein
MNIFCLSECPIQSAKWLVDRHTIKMVLESAQMLANCFTEEQLEVPDCPKTKKGTSRKHSYYNHPCSIWVRQSKENMQWLINHALAIEQERVERYQTPEHFSIPFIHWCQKNILLSPIPSGDMTKFALAMPDEYKTDNSVESYRNYYKHGKSHLHSWKQNKPDWI